MISLIMILINFSEISDDEILLTTEKDYYGIDEKLSRFECVEINVDIENRNEFINLIKNKI